MSRRRLKGLKKVPNEEVVPGKRWGVSEKTNVIPASVGRKTGAVWYLWCPILSQRINFVSVGFPIPRSSRILKIDVLESSAKNYRILNCLPNPFSPTGRDNQGLAIFPLPCFVAPPTSTPFSPLDSCVSATRTQSGRAGRWRE